VDLEHEMMKENSQFIKQSSDCIWSFHYIGA